MGRTAPDRRVHADLPATVGAVVEPRPWPMPKTTEVPDSARVIGKPEIWKDSALPWPRPIVDTHDLTVRHLHRLRSVALGHQGSGTTDDTCFGQRRHDDDARSWLRRPIEVTGLMLDLERHDMHRGASGAFTHESPRVLEVILFGDVSERHLVLAEDFVDGGGIGRLQSRAPAEVLRVTCPAEVVLGIR